MTEWYDRRVEDAISNLYDVLDLLAFIDGCSEADHAVELINRAINILENNEVGEELDEEEEEEKDPFLFY